MSLRTVRPVLSLLGVLLTATAVDAQNAPVRAKAEVAQLVADCNAITATSKAKRGHIRACETLASEGRLSLVEPAAATAYQQYRDERLQACLGRQASPRGQSRGQSECEP